MLARICFLLFLLFSPVSHSEEDQAKEDKKSGYRYVIENYFAKRRAKSAYQDYSRSFNLFGGASFYRENTEKSFKPLSSVIIGFNQKIKELTNLGDLSLQIALFSGQMQRQRAFLLEITPRISIPEIRTAFPLYMGLGFGAGFYPKNIIRKLPALSLNSQFFIGFRFFDLYHNLGFSAELNLRIHFPFNELNIYLEGLGQLGLIFRF